MEDLQRLSIADLATIDVSSVSKESQSLSDAPAAIYVITHDEIIRSGALTLPEALRLAPNLFVSRTSASHYVITARGFSGNSADQSFSDKLLVLIDGRSAYTPLFSGVYWDMQDVVLSDVDRIEVISGPGATLWGANAVNGVINIITKAASQTQGVSADVGGGNLDSRARVTVGGMSGPSLAWRAYAKVIYSDHTETPDGSSLIDHSARTQGGFRLDFTPSSLDSLTLQGDAFQGKNAQPGAPDEDISGRNLLGRWTHAWTSGSNLQVQTYYDRSWRKTEQGGGSFYLDTYDVDLQHSFALGARNDVVWGGGVRFNRYKIFGTASLQFDPAFNTKSLANGFVQDTLSLSDRAKLILGVKLEDEPYTGLEALPSVRLSWTPTRQAMLWAAASRAVRSATPFDRDVVEKFGPIVYLIGGPDFQPETLWAYEAGVRVQPTQSLSFSASGYFNVYTDLRTIEPAPGTFIPFRWGNQMEGHTYGLEAWGAWQAAPWWRLRGGVDLLSKHLKFKPGASGLLGVAQAGDDPKTQAFLKSSMDLAHNVTLDADLRYVSELPDPVVPAYVELNGRLAWAMTKHVEVALAGFNLLHERHLEFPAAFASAIPRSVVADVRFRF